MKQAVVLVGHGSKKDGAEDSLRAVLHSLQKKEPDTFFQIAFLEIASPSISETVALCAEKGSEEIVIMPYFVHAGRHVAEDIPAVVLELQKKYPKIKIRLSGHLSFDERLVSLVMDQIKKSRQN